jgi:hypothetical protein
VSAFGRHGAGVRVRDTHGASSWGPGVEGLSFADARDGEQTQLPDLAPESVDGSIVAPGAIDGGIHIIPATLGMDLFAETIVPPRVLDALPALPDADYPEGSLVFLTTDGKLYRNVADAWTVEVDGADILANSITAGQIAVGAIGADEIAAGAITTEKFHVGAKAPGVENSTSEVLIDSTGITILNGKITLADYSGLSVLTAAGFAGAWVDFLSGGIYNHAFTAGNGFVFAATEVGTGSTPADYQASLSEDVPYWVFSEVSVGASAGVQTQFGGIRDVLAVGLNTADTVEFYQDVPVANGASYRLFVSTEAHLALATAGSEFQIAITAEPRDATHGTYGAAVIDIHTATYEFDVASPYGPFEVEPYNADGGFLRLRIRVERTSGTGEALFELAAVRLEQQPAGINTLFDSDLGGVTIHSSSVGHGDLRFSGPGGINFGWSDSLPSGAMRLIQASANLRFEGESSEGWAGVEIDGELLFAGGGAADVSLVRGAAGRLDLSSGDTLRISDTGQLEFGTDTLIRRVGANVLSLGNGNELRSSGEAWTGVTFSGTWTNFGGAWNTAAYRKDAQGYVHLKGTIKSGTIGTAAFTLPAGYRPAADGRHACVSNNAFGSCTITSAGVVTPSVGSNASFMLDGITFKAEN